VLLRRHQPYDVLFRRQPAIESVDYRRRNQGLRQRQPFLDYRVLLQGEVVGYLNNEDVLALGAVHGVRSSCAEEDPVVSLSNMYLSAPSRKPSMRIAWGLSVVWNRITATSTAILLRRRCVPEAPSTVRQQSARSPRESHKRRTVPNSSQRTRCGSEPSSAH